MSIGVFGFGVFVFFDVGSLGVFCGRVVKVCGSGVWLCMGWWWLCWLVWRVVRVLLEGWCMLVVFR